MLDSVKVGLCVCVFVCLVFMQIAKPEIRKEIKFWLVIEVIFDESMIKCISIG